MITNDFEKVSINISASQIEQWSKFSDVIDHAQCLSL